MNKLKGAFGIAEIIAFTLVILILGSLMYTLTDIVKFNATGSNVTGASATLIGLLPLLVVVIVIVSAVKFHDA